MRKLIPMLSKFSWARTLKSIRGRTLPTLKLLRSSGERAWLGGVAAMGDFSQQIGQTEFVTKLNTYKSEVSKAMDSGFKIGQIDAETGLAMTPHNHRILDGGHGLFESLESAREVGKQNGWSDIETFQTWLSSFFTDLSSPAGMPFFGRLTDDCYSLLRAMGVKEEIARDFLTVNGPEAVEALIGGTLSAVGLFMAWKKEDKENFSRAIGAIGLGSVASLNPAVLTIVIVAAALGYNELVFHKAVTRGAIASSTMMLTSLLIPGPLLLGVIPGIVLAVYVNKKMGKEYDFAAHVRLMYGNLQDPATRQKIATTINAIVEDLRGSRIVPKKSAM